MLNYLSIIQAQENIDKCMKAWLRRWRDIGTHEGQVNKCSFRVSLLISLFQAEDFHKDFRARVLTQKTFLCSFPKNYCQNCCSQLQNTPCKTSNALLIVWKEIMSCFFIILSFKDSQRSLNFLNGKRESNSFFPTTKR